MSCNIVIAVDGPAGAGKSTIARDLAVRLNLKYLDTGAMYRAITLFVLENGIDPKDKLSIKFFLDQIDIDMKTDKDGFNRTYLNGDDVTEKIRRPNVSKAVSYVADNYDVREFLVSKQREIGKTGAVVDGRDIGTRVFPDADIKFYLTASIEERTQRRWVELIEQGYITTKEEVKKDLLSRDQLDKNRALNPLKQADDAYLVDTTNLNREDVLNKLIKYIKE